MAWKEQCEIAFGVACKRYVHNGMGVRKALRTLSDESGIPYNTLKRWHYTEKDKGVVKNDNTDDTKCEKCQERPKRTSTDTKTGKTYIHPLCHVCQRAEVRKKQLKQLKMVQGQINSIASRIQKEGNREWSGRIRKGEYEEFINTLKEVVNIWQEVS